MLLCMNAHKISWDDIRIAYEVLKQGNLSKAAEALDIHHATVFRRIKSLEADLGVTLFHKHARGYTATEEGKIFFRSTDLIDEQIDQLINQLHGMTRGISGDLTVTVVPGHSSFWNAHFKKFHDQHPEITITTIVSNSHLKLEKGEAHVSIRVGDRPQEGDYIAQKICQLELTFYATQDYITRHGKPLALHELDHHKILSLTEGFKKKDHIINWIDAHIPSRQIVFRSNLWTDIVNAIGNGFGIGPLDVWQAQQVPDAIPLFAPQEGWVEEVWFLTHMDLHRTPRIQTFLNFLKAVAKDNRSGGFALADQVKHR